MLTARGRRVRGLVAGATLAVLLIGTFWGEDDNFPFGPFRMYAYTTKTTGVVTAGRVEGVTEDGERVGFGAATLGLRRAEIEGQMPRFAEDPDALADLADAYAERNPGEPKLVGIRVYKQVYRLVDGEIDGRETETIAEWGERG